MVVCPPTPERQVGPRVRPKPGFVHRPDRECVRLPVGKTPDTDRQHADINGTRPVPDAGHDVAGRDALAGVRRRDRGKRQPTVA